MRNPFVDRYGLNGFGISLVIVVIVALIVGATFFFVNMGMAAACRQESSTMHMPTKWHAMSGCYLQVNGQWVPDSTYVNNQGN